MQHKTRLFSKIVMPVVLVALLVGVVVVQQKAASRSDALETKVQSLQKRTATLEAANKFDEKQVKKDRYQAVFLTEKQDEQVYFGKITAITEDTIKLEDIYYLRTGAVDRSGEPVSDTDVSLVKLGQELHGPEDIMNIERKNVAFWENLKPDGQVSQAIEDFKKSGD